MLPSILARQIKEGLIEYINAVYPITTDIFADSMQQILQDKDLVFHNPYVTVKLPFRPAENYSLENFTSLKPKYHPYVHQKMSFDRLLGDEPRSTLVATGTGSGKTECFIYPILEYCYQHRLEPGIKALIIYPMNALASDQAKRIASLIYSSAELTGDVTVGMYVGGEKKNQSEVIVKNKVITHHETLIKYPPSILLTNYKMLDYLLVRPKDSALWKNNGPQTLKYIVVDELHSFDGAQGTDLACLLRRLKSRLNIEKNIFVAWVLQRPWVATIRPMGLPNTPREFSVNLSTQIP
jgi:DEAD/DEAH box helicase domain-containing protein